MAFDAQLAAQWDQRLAADPTFRQLTSILAKYSGPPGSQQWDPQDVAIVQQIARHYGATFDPTNPADQWAVSVALPGKVAESLGLPPGMSFGADGRLTDKGGDFPSWSKYAMLAIGGAGAAAGALAGAAGSAAETAPEFVGPTLAQAAAPAAGGILGTAGRLAMNPLIGGLASTVGHSILAGRQAAREREAAANAQADRFRLGAAEFNREAPVVRARQAVRGDLLANAQPAGSVGAGRDFRFTGGLTPAMFSQGTRDLGTSMNRQAVLSQLQGGAPGSDAFTLAGATPLPQTGLTERILGPAVMGLDIASQLPFGQRQRVPPPEPGYDYDPYGG